MLSVALLRTFIRGSSLREACDRSQQARVLLSLVLRGHTRSHSEHARAMSSCILVSAPVPELSKPFIVFPGGYAMVMRCSGFFVYCILNSHATLCRCSPLVPFWTGHITPCSTGLETCLPLTLHAPSKVLSLNRDFQCVPQSQSHCTEGTVPCTDPSKVKLRRSAFYLDVACQLSAFCCGNQPGAFWQSFLSSSDDGTAGCMLRLH